MARKGEVRTHNHWCSRDFGLEASGPGRQESKFGGESKPLKKRSTLLRKARKQETFRALCAQKKVVTSQKSKKARFFPGGLALRFSANGGPAAPMHTTQSSGGRSVTPDSFLHGSERYHRKLATPVKGILGRLSSHDVREQAWQLERPS